MIDKLRQESCTRNDKIDKIQKIVKIRKTVQILQGFKDGSGWVQEYKCQCQYQWGGVQGPVPTAAETARGESLKKSVTGMGGVSHNPTCTPQGPRTVQVLRGWKVANHLLSRAYDTLQSVLAFTHEYPLDTCSRHYCSDPVLLCHSAIKLRFESATVHYGRQLALQYNTKCSQLKD